MQTRSRKIIWIHMELNLQDLVDSFLTFQDPPTFNFFLGSILEEEFKGEIMRKINGQEDPDVNSIIVGVEDPGEILLAKRILFTSFKNNQ